MSLTLQLCAAPLKAAACTDGAMCTAMPDMLFVVDSCVQQSQHLSKGGKHCLDVHNVCVHSILPQAVVNNTVKT